MGLLELIPRMRNYPKMCQDNPAFPNPSRPFREALMSLGRGRSRGNPTRAVGSGRRWHRGWAHREIPWDPEGSFGIAAGQWESWISPWVILGSILGWRGGVTSAPSPDPTAGMGWIPGNGMDPREGDGSQGRGWIQGNGVDPMEMRGSHENEVDPKEIGWIPRKWGGSHGNGADPMEMGWIPWK